MSHIVRVAVTRRDGKERALMNTKETSAKRNEDVTWYCTNLDDDDLWVQVWDFKKGGKKKNPLRQTNPSVRVPGAGAGGAPNTEPIEADVDGNAETGSYTYKIRVGTSSNNLNVASDPKLRVDDNGVLPKGRRRKARKKATKRKK